MSKLSATAPEPRLPAVVFPHDAHGFTLVTMILSKLCHSLPGPWHLVTVAEQVLLRQLVSVVEQRVVRLRPSLGLGPSA